MNKQLEKYKIQAEVDYLNEASNDTLRLLSHIEKLEAENDKLKDALNLIIKQFPVDYDIRITEIAREALKGT